MLDDPSERLVDSALASKVRPEVGVDGYDLPDAATGVMASTRSTPKAVVADLRHLLQGFLPWLALVTRLLRRFVVHESRGLAGKLDSSVPHFSSPPQVIFPASVLLEREGRRSLPAHRLAPFAVGLKLRVGQTNVLLDQRRALASHTDRERGRCALNAHR